MYLVYVCVRARVFLCKRKIVFVYGYLSDGMIFFLFMVSRDRTNMSCLSQWSLTIQPRVVLLVSANFCEPSPTFGYKFKLLYLLQPKLLLKKSYPIILATVLFQASTTYCPLPSIFPLLLLFGGIVLKQIVFCTQATEYINSLITDTADGDTEEELARKKVREEFKKISPYLPMVSQIWSCRKFGEK